MARSMMRLNDRNQIPRCTLRYPVAQLSGKLLCRFWCFNGLRVFRFVSGQNPDWKEFYSSGAEIKQCVFDAVAEHAEEVSH